VSVFETTAGVYLMYIHSSMQLPECKTVITNEKITLTFDPWPWNSIRFVRFSIYMFM